MAFFIRLAVKLKEIFWRTRALLRGSTSQFGQDLQIIKAFDEMRDGVFVDVGASDGYTGSNTYVLEKKYGWTGLCIEPNDRFFQQLHTSRSCICEHACIAGEEKDVAFLECADEYGGMVNDYSDAHRKNMQRCLPAHQYQHADGTLKTVTKHAVTLGSLLEKHALPAFIDLLCMDTEGSESEILESIPFDRYQFSLILVEHFSGDEQKAELCDVLTLHGYVLWKEKGIELYFRHTSFAPAS